MQLLVLVYAWMNCDSICMIIYLIKLYYSSYGFKLWWTFFIGDESNYANGVGQSGLSVESRDAIFVPQKFDFAPAFVSSCRILNFNLCILHYMKWEKATNLWCLVQACMNPPYNDATYAGFLASCGLSSLVSLHVCLI